MLRKNNYASIPFIQGPRQKRNATTYYEKLIKDILQSYHDQRDIQVSYNSLNEVVITANGHFYNLAQLLKHHPDFEQLSFSQDDLAIYDKFLRDPKTINNHIEREANEDQLKKMAQAFPEMARAEMSAINRYTADMFEPMNFLLKFTASKRFPKSNYPMSFLIRIAQMLDPDFDLSDPTYDPDNPIFLTIAVQETLLNTAITASALSKPVQAELNICIAASCNDLENNLMRVSGMSLALIPKNNQYEIVMIAYGKIINQSLILLDINKTLFAHQTTYSDGIVLLPEEYNEITSQLNLSDKFSLLESLTPSTKTKFIDILTAVESVNDLLYEKIIRVEEDVDYFASTYLPTIYETLNTSNGFHFYKGFYSASAEFLEQFKSPGLNIITTLINPIMFGKNIESISYVPSEQERLLIPEQQFTYTEAISLTDKDNQTEIHLAGFPSRSIDGIDSYSHEDMLFREKTIDHTRAENKNTKAAEMQFSAASRVQPSFSGVSHWFASSAKSAGNFLYLNLIEKPVAELGCFSKYYLDYLQNITVEQCVIAALSDNSHSLFPSPLNNATSNIASYPASLKLRN